MATNYPGSLDGTANVGGGTEPEAVTALDDSTSGHPTHAGLHQNVGDAVQQLETKLGIGSSTPSANQVLGCASGSSSSWTDSPSVANLTLSADLTAVDATLSGDVTAVNATLSGDVTAVNARLSGDILDSLGTTILDISTATLNGDITGNAATATSVSGGVETADRWTTARTLSLTGDVTGSVSIDGSANASMSTTVANDSHSHSDYITSDSNDTATGKYTFSNTSGSTAGNQTLNLSCTGSSPVGAGISFQYPTKGATYSGIIRPSNSNAERLVVLQDDNTNVEDLQVRVLYYSGGSLGSSDERLKTNEGPSLGLSFVNRLEPFTGKWTDSSVDEMSFDDKKHWFLGAQTVEAAMTAEGLNPAEYRVTEDDGNGYKVMSYMEMVPVLIKAVQELSARVEALEAR